MATLMGVPALIVVNFLIQTKFSKQMINSYEVNVCPQKNETLSIRIVLWAEENPKTLFEIILEGSETEGEYSNYYPSFEKALERVKQIVLDRRRRAMKMMFSTNDAMEKIYETAAP